jgi:5-methylcytosine-specific restriction protein A
LRFDDIEKGKGLVVRLRSYGLKSHRVELKFESFSRPTLAQISKASYEDRILARALINSIDRAVEVDVVGQNLENWTVTNGQFQIVSKVDYHQKADSPNAIINTCRNILVPIMAAMAELIGYDDITLEQELGEFEGAVKKREILQRERNPRNRLLCLRVHGYKCACCGLCPLEVFGEAGKIIEVHHLQPVSLLNEPIQFHPKSDLVPLCANCHRAVHTKKPIPYSIEKLQSILVQYAS